VLFILMLGGGPGSDGAFAKGGRAALPVNVLAFPPIWDGGAFAEPRTRRSASLQTDESSGGTESQMRPGSCHTGLRFRHWGGSGGASGPGNAYRLN